MDSQLFLYLNLALAVFFLGWFWTARKNRGMTPTRLRLRTSSREMGTSKSQIPTTSRYSNPLPKNSFSEDSVVRKAKNLNILFLYNGHDWDAYEVLGVPAGASLPLVTEKYQKLVKEADQGQLEFYQAAYQAILKKL